MSRSDPITVLLPCKDPTPHLLRDALGSVVRQTSSRWRLLVLVDEPDPRVSGLVDALGDERIEVLRGAGGFARALNAGLEHASSEFACILLADDRLAPSAVEELRRQIRRHPRVDFFYSRRRYIDAAGRPIPGAGRLVRRFDLDRFRRLGSPVKHLLCFRRERALAIGGMDEELSRHGCDDYDFPWRMAEAGCRFRAVDSVLYEYRRHRDGERLTTSVPLEEQVATLRKMFAKHDVPERETEVYVEHALTSYLVTSHAETQVDPRRRFSVSLHRDAGAEREPDFVAKGLRARHFFPHRVYVLPKGGPDGMKLAKRMCKARSTAGLAELVLYALPPVSDEIPEELFLDDDLQWHRQHFGRVGQVATANLFVEGSTAWGMVYLSDLVQRIGRRRDHKTRVENRFKGWPYLLLNALLDVARDRGVREVRSATAALAMRHTDPTRPVQAPLFQRVYDVAVQQGFEARREDDWWVIDVALNEGRIVPLAHGFEARELPPTVCVVHDVERGLGHRDVDPAFAELADREAPAALERMLEIERTAGVRATYSVVGALLPELREPIEADGHALAFHSFDHTFAEEPPRWRRLFGGKSTVPDSRGDDWQLDRCRAIDYRIRGYRPPRSVLGHRLRDATLAFHNFEWLASSAHSFGFREPRLENGLVKLPILFDDFDLHRGRMDWEAFERRVLEAMEEHPCLAFGLHDCYAGHWLPHYERLLALVGERARLATLDQVAAETTLGAARWF